MRDEGDEEANAETVFNVSCMIDTSLRCAPASPSGIQYVRDGWGVWGGAASPTREITDRPGIR